MIASKKEVDHKSSRRPHANPYQKKRRRNNKTKGIKKIIKEKEEQHKQEKKDMRECEQNNN